MNTKFTKTVAVTGLTVSAFVAVCGFANTAFADETPVVNTPVVDTSKDQNPQNKLQNLFKAAQPQAEDKAAEKDQKVDDQNLGPIDDNTVKVAAGLAKQTLDEFEEYARSVGKKLSEEQRALYKKDLKTKVETLQRTYLEALDYAETIVKYSVQGADGSLKAAAEEFLKNRDNLQGKSFAESDLATINNVWASSDEFNKKITAKNLKNAIAQAKKKASEDAQSGAADSHVESPASPAAPSSPAPSSPTPASPEAPNPADSEEPSAPKAPENSESSNDEKNEAPSSAGTPSAGSSSEGAPSAGASSEDEISDLDIEDDWLKEISDYLESPEFDDLNLDDFDLSDLDDFNLDDFNLDDIDLSNLDDFNLDDFDFSDIDLNA